jgi:TM2 domain-containing membrane protein YozV
MKKVLIVCIIALCSVGSAFGQDILTLKSGEEIEVLVTEIDQKTVWYKKFNNLDGPLYSLPKSDIFMIKYPNGEKDVFSLATTTQSMQGYNRKEPGVACILSLLLPGGGQYYNGQYAKGALMTALYAASIVGMATNTSTSYDYYDNPYYHTESNSSLGFFVLLYIGDYLWSVIDAPISANKINKQNLLSWNLSKNTNISLRPDIRLADTFRTGNSFYSPSYGAKLVLSLK